jgi:polyisoprenoid-binding protein YceI
MSASSPRSVVFSMRARSRCSPVLWVIAVGWLSLVATGRTATAQPPVPTTIDTAASRVYVFVDKGGLIGHMHAIAGRLAGGQIAFGSRQNAGSLTFDMRSFIADTPEARRALRLEGAVDASTQQQTTTNMLGPDVLDVQRHPAAVFTIQSAVPVPVPRPAAAPAYRLEGTFSLHGTSRPLTVVVTLEDHPDHVVMRGSFPLEQTDYGIKPYAKLGGVISIADTLQVHGVIRLVKQPAAVPTINEIPR